VNTISFRTTDELQRVYIKIGFLYKDFNLNGQREILFCEIALGEILFCEIVLADTALGEIPFGEIS
jgi:hypothetical protein